MPGGVRMITSISVECGNDPLRCGAAISVDDRSASERVARDNTGPSERPSYATPGRCGSSFARDRCPDLVVAPPGSRSGRCSAPKNASIRALSGRFRASFGRGVSGIWHRMQGRCRVPPASNDRPRRPGGRGGHAQVSHDDMTTASDGTTIAWSRRGSGTPVVLVHGITESAATFDPVVERLLAHDPGLEVITLDLRGHGESGMSATYDLAAMVGDVIAVIGAAGHLDHETARRRSPGGSFPRWRGRVGGRGGDPGGERGRHRPVTPVVGVQGATRRCRVGATRSRAVRIRDRGAVRLDERTAAERRRARPGGRCPPTRSGRGPRRVGSPAHHSRTAHRGDRRRHARRLRRSPHAVPRPVRHRPRAPGTPSGSPEGCRAQSSRPGRTTATTPTWSTRIDSSTASSRSGPARPVADPEPRETAPDDLGTGGTTARAR